MAAVVSHAMRRFPLSPPDTVFSSYGFNNEEKVAGCSWEASGVEGGLSRSMRYADPWLYGSVRAAPGFVLAPVSLNLCSCSDYLNGTKRSKKGPSTCKKCRGTRLPLDKFGTVRCVPTNFGSSSTPLRAGTVRVTSSSSRASILPENDSDPYNLMRRSRLGGTDKGSSHFRARSVSPKTSKFGENGFNLTTPKSSNSSAAGRRSILECDINPYELMAGEDANIQMVNGQRIRVQSNSSPRQPLPPPDYEDVEGPEQHPQASRIPKPVKAQKNKENISQAQQTHQKSNPPNEKETDCNTIININHSNNRFKSILKKRSSDIIKTPPSLSPATPKSGSHFYLPMPTSRKKVQFLVQESENKEDEELQNTTTPPSSDGEYEDVDDILAPQEEEISVSVINVVNDEPKTLLSEEKRECKLRRSISDRIKHEPQKVVFLDSMALRGKPLRVDTRYAFGDTYLEKLDGVSPRVRKISPAKERPKEPPPPPPSKPEEQSDAKEIIKEEITNIEEVPLQPIKENSKASNPEETKIEILPPEAPPRKRSNNKQPMIEVLPLNISITKQEITWAQTASNEKQTLKIEPVCDYSNRTIVQISSPTPTSPVHKLQILNTFDLGPTAVSMTENPQRKTSILINGDDCYSTVNVNDDVPLYQSSVVVKDCGLYEVNKNSSSVYISGNFSKPEIYDGTRAKFTEAQQNEMNDKLKDCEESKVLCDILKNPVEAVKRNLVPHICGKSDVSRRPAKTVRTRRTLESLNESPLEQLLKQEIEKPSLDDDTYSENSSTSTQYEPVDLGSDCYTDHSNRSSVTEEELASRTKFYELLADATLAEVDHHYECINSKKQEAEDPIYEEIEIPPPLPSNPPPSALLDDLNIDKEFTTRSIFEGASKYDILSYLVDAKERGIVPEDSYTYNFANAGVVVEDAKEAYSHRGSSHMSNVSDSSEDNSLIISGAIIDDKATFPKQTEVERNDSGVGSETSKTSISKYRTKPEVSVLVCEDCDAEIDLTDSEPLVCRKCLKKRIERKEIIMEIVETEEKYSKDLQIILEEFYQPMLVAGLLTPDQLSAIFLNVEELLENSQALAERLRDAVEITLEQGDEDLLTVNMGKLFMEAAPMLHAFETYCVRQGSASLLLASLEKDKELLRIFLRVSQMENAVLRRMNLNSFLMVPVQRVTKYPLLLARLLKVTPEPRREQLQEAQHQVELHLNHMNAETRDVPSRLWRRLASGPGRRASAEMDLVNIKLRKIAVDVLEWNHEEAKFALEGKLFYTQPTDNNWRKGRTIKLTTVNALLVINGKTTRGGTAEGGLVFSNGTREAALLLVRDKHGRHSLLRDPLYLDRCVIAADPAWHSYFEVQELLGKDTFIFKAEDDDQTKIWYRQLQYHAQGMGAWRKRRNALANIMINGMGLRS